MSESETAPDAAAPKRSKKPLLIGLVLALILGGGGFYAVYSGMIGGEAEHAEATAPEVPTLPDIAFVPLEPLVISLGARSASKHLRFTAQLEVALGHQDEVTVLMPRVLDVLNSYLRAIEVAELEDPTALVRLRAQMLRRVQVVTGDGRVRDLLVTEFVLN